MPARRRAPQVRRGPTPPAPPPPPPPPAHVQHRRLDHQVLDRDRVDRRLAAEVRRRVDVRAGVLVERPRPHVEALAGDAELVGHLHRVVDGIQRRLRRQRVREVDGASHGGSILPRPMSDAREATERAYAGGPRRHHEKSEQQGKLPVRDRVTRLLDPDSLVEDGLLANWEGEGLGADGVVTGTGTIDGRPVALMANDPTVKAGSWGPKTVEKILRIQEKALSHRI